MRAGCGPALSGCNDKHTAAGASQVTQRSEE
jgi:hypothetical protein